MTKEMIKAIRIVNGFNPDLRVKLTNINSNSLRQWIEENRAGIFGIDYAVKPDARSPEWEAYERKLDRAVYAVVWGVPTND